MLSCNLQKMRAVEIRTMGSGGEGGEERTRHGHLHPSCLKRLQPGLKRNKQSTSLFMS